MELKSFKESIDSLQKILHEKQAEILNLENECVFLQQEIILLQIHPFKLGDEVIAEVPMGRVKKKCKCILEMIGTILYVRPYKSDGELSNRRYSVNPVDGKTYKDYLEEA